MWVFDEHDRELSGQLSDFLPDKIFDFHAHLYRTGDLNITGPGFLDEGPSEADVKVWKKYLSGFVGKERLRGGLFFPYPSVGCDIISANNYLIDRVKGESLSRGLVLATPGMEAVELSAFLDNPLICGIKPYHIFSSEQPTFESSVNGYFPEWQWEIANHYGCVVMLHLVKKGAVADPDNLKEIRGMCSRYPNIKLVLAHAGRCFHWPNADGIKQLRGLENVWFDTSAICEPEAFMMILKEFGPRKLLWGSDFPVCMIKGRSVTAGDGFVWIDNGFCNWERSSFANPVVVGIESLRALRWACEETGLNGDDISDIFYNNAFGLLNVNNGTLSGTPENELLSRTQSLYQHAMHRIPGGTQLLSKRPEMMAPGKWPAYFREARGCEVWDLDGKHYYDMASNGIGACLLGFNDPDVNKALRRRINLGSMCTLNPPEEVELADLLCDIHPWAEQARFTRSGGEACAVAVRIARATTGRSVVAVCGYHGWHDWYLAANLGASDALQGHLLPGLNPVGVPGELRDTAFTFRFNNRQELQSIIDRYGKRLAAVIMEPCRNEDPEPGFLEFVREATTKTGALLIFDEITIGWRLHFGGSHMKFGIIPDIAVFAKSLGNGVPTGAVIGTRAAMDGANISFISSTYWTESLGPAASVATLKKMEKINVPAHVELTGRSIMKSWESLAEKHQMPVETSGYPCLAHFRFNHKQSEKLRTIYTRLMLDRGFLAGLSVYPTIAHTPEIIQLYHEAIDEVFGEIADIIKEGSAGRFPDNMTAHSGFARLL